MSFCLRGWLAAAMLLSLALVSSDLGVIKFPRIYSLSQSYIVVIVIRMPESIEEKRASKQAHGENEWMTCVLVVIKRRLNCTIVLHYMVMTMLVLMMIHTRYWRRASWGRWWLKLCVYYSSLGNSSSSSHSSGNSLNHLGFSRILE